MNADIDKIRRTRLCKNLPERAFEKLISLIKIRVFQNGEDVLQYGRDREFEKHFGYVIQGRVLFLAADSKPLGVVIKDEFFLGRSFSLNDTPVHRVIAAAEGTLVFFFPKEVFSSLSQANHDYAEMLEEIYESIFERAKLIGKDPTAPKTIQDWIVSPDQGKTLSDWVGVIEKKRLQGLEKKAKDSRQRAKLVGIWTIVLMFAGVLTYESLLRHWERGYSWIEKWIPYFRLEEFQPGTRWNIFLGIAGFSFVILTMGHTLVKMGIRKWHWKVNFQMSQQIHLMFGILGSYLIVLHVAFGVSGVNIAYWAYYAVMISVFTGFVGHFISSQIPTSIRGEKLRLDSLKGEQQKLQQKAEMLLHDDQLYKTSVIMISQGVPSNFWANLIQGPLLFLKARQVQSSLEDLGMGSRGAKVAADLIRKEFQMRQKIKFLEFSNAALKRWLLIHKPIAYCAYALGFVHVILVLLSL